MLRLKKVVKTFPSARIPAPAGGAPVEVSLVAQLGHGAGNHLFAAIASRQQNHAAFIDELDEPSAKLAATDFERGDATALYSFIVGPKGHPFHRHAGHRIFTAVSGSGGAQLRFSHATAEDIETDPAGFLRSLHFINIPPDCLFTVRFGGETWHQFYPLTLGSLHPVFFALSVHTNELGGNLSAALKEKVLADDADIPALTELLPLTVQTLLHAREFDPRSVPTTMLSLDAPEGTFHRLVCNTFRGGAGKLRGAWGAWKGAGGYLSYAGPARPIRAFGAPPADSLLQRHLASAAIDHDDTFGMELGGFDLRDVGASRLLALLLEGFLVTAPRGVSFLMGLRNLLVKPLGLRTSPLSCPVSSLLSPKASNLFAGQFPVLDQEVDTGDRFAQVLLGADDKHLSFRSCVGVKISTDNKVIVTLGTRVRCRNAFGRFYMRAIDRVHRAYISPTILRRAVEYMVVQSGLGPQ